MKTDTPLESFCFKVAENYGNPRAQFAAEPAHLWPRQLVKVFLPGFDICVTARATGRKTAKGEHILKVKKNDRTWTVNARNTEILISW